MRASEIKTLTPTGTVVLPDFCFQGRVPAVQCFFNPTTDVAFQLWEEAGKYRHTDPLQDQGRPFGDWKLLTAE